MSSVVVASDEQDAAAVEAVRTHHAQLSGALSALSEAVAAGARKGEVSLPKGRLLEWAQRELVPHALAEETSIYPLARAEERGRLLVDAMLAEHRLIRDTVARIGTEQDPVRLAGLAAAFAALFASHRAKEDDQILPLLAGSRHSLADALAGMHELLGGQDGGDGSAHPAGDLVSSQLAGDLVSSQPASSPAPACGCAEDGSAELPELDARSVPHAIRHATIFGALESLRPEAGLVLVAPHDPLPLLAQVEERTPGRFTVDYLERGPELWRLRFRRTS